MVREISILIKILAQIFRYKPLPTEIIFAIITLVIWLIPQAKSTLIISIKEIQIIHFWVNSKQNLSQKIDLVIKIFYLLIYYV